jgi:hypothetical protein
MVFRHFPCHCIICIRCRVSQQHIMWAVSPVQRRDQLLVLPMDLIIRNSMWWVLCSHATFIHKALVRRSPDRVGNDGWSQVSGGDVLSQRGPLAEQSVNHLNRCFLSLVFLYLVWPGRDNSFVCKYRMRTQHSSNPWWWDKYSLWNVGHKVYIDTADRPRRFHGILSPWKLQIQIGYWQLPGQTQSTRLQTVGWGNGARYVTENALPLLSPAFLSTKSWKRQRRSWWKVSLGYSCHGESLPRGIESDYVGWLRLAT